MDISAAVLQRLGTALPPERLLARPEQLAACESDALTAFQTRPLAVAMPETADEVIALVRLCHELKLPFVARIAATGPAPDGEGRGDFEGMTAWAADGHR